KLSGYGPAPHLSQLLLPYPVTAVLPQWLLPSHQWSESRGGSPRAGLLSKGGERAQVDTERRVGRVGLVLTPTHYRLLELLFLHPFLTHAQIATFLDAQTSTVKKWLATLHQLACVEAEHLTTGDTGHVRLESRGLRLLALRHHLSPR